MDFLSGKTIIHREKDLISADVVLKKKCLILYYFTSGECEGCRLFDVKLKEVYHEALCRRVEIAVIVVSTDPDLESFANNIKNNYHEFYAVQFDDELAPTLLFNYGVTHIPTLVVVRKNGDLVTKDGKSDVEKIGINVLVTWAE